MDVEIERTVLLPVADELADDEANLYDKIEDVSSRNIGLKLSG
jgi:hypothetical protein